MINPAYKITETPAGFGREQYVVKLGDVTLARKDTRFEAEVAAIKDELERSGSA